MGLTIVGKIRLMIVWRRTCSRSARARCGGLRPCRGSWRWPPPPPPRPLPPPRVPLPASAPPARVP
eukprot:2026490-Pleurochrysis_carterae.AAC.1